VFRILPTSSVGEVFRVWGGRGRGFPEKLKV